MNKDNETIEKLLTSTFIGRPSLTEAGRLSLMKDVLSPNPLSTINENDSINGLCIVIYLSYLVLIHSLLSGSIFTISDVDLTEGDDLEMSTTRSGRPYRRSSNKRMSRSHSPDKRPSKRPSRSMEADVCHELHENIPTML